MKVLGRTMLSTVGAFAHRGAISSSLNPAMPQPMRVTRKTYSGCDLANSINLSAYGLIVSTPPCIVGMAYDCPNRPTPCPHTEPDLSRATRAAPPQRQP